MSQPPNFGRRGIGPTPLTHAPSGLAPRRRMRSHMVVIGCAGALALSFAAAAEYRHRECQPKDPTDPNSIPDSCRNSSHGHGYGGGYGGGSAGHGASSSASHASFGGFGGSGGGHGGSS